MWLGSANMKQWDWHEAVCYLKFKTVMLNDPTDSEKGGIASANIAPGTHSTHVHVTAVTGSTLVVTVNCIWYQCIELQLSLKVSVWIRYQSSSSICIFICQNESQCSNVLLLFNSCMWHLLQTYLTTLYHKISEKGLTRCLLSLFKHVNIAWGNEVHGKRKPWCAVEMYFSARCDFNPAKSYADTDIRY